MIGIEIVVLLIKLFLVFNIIMGLASFCTWVERKGSALIQDRIGANRAGAYFDFNYGIFKRWPLPLRIVGGLLFAGGTLGKPLVSYFIFAISPTLWELAVVAIGIGLSIIAAQQITYGVAYVIVAGIKFAGQLGIINTLLNDAVKALFKEDFVPEGVSNFLHCLAPFMAVFPVFVAFALIPLAPDFELMGYVVRPQLASLNVGVLFVLAMGSISVYGVALAGYTGNNKYSLLGGLRAAAQMISYELAMGLSIVTAIVVYGSADLYDMVVRQSGSITNWGIITQPVGFVVLFIAGFAETKRAPFDLPESESELVAGYFTEYSGMKFLIFWLGEFAEIALFSLLLTVMFFGGWHIPFVEFPKNVWWASLIGHGVLMGKVIFLCVLQIVIRWTLPRLRFDQLMVLGWKYLLPISLVNLLVTATVVLMLN